MCVRSYVVWEAALASVFLLFPIHTALCCPPAPAGPLLLRRLQVAAVVLENTFFNVSKMVDKVRTEDAPRFVPKT